MSVLVKKFTVQANGKEYGPGETITGLSSTEEKRLIQEGYCDAFAVLQPDANKIQDPNGGTSATSSAGEGGPNTSIPLK